MRKPLLLILTNAGLVLAVFALLAQSLFIVKRVARTQHIEGEVSVRRGANGVFTPLSQGQALQIGDTVRTGRGHAEFRFLDGTRWKIFPRSELTLRDATVDSARKSEISRLQLASGEVLVRLSKILSPDSRFEIETPGALATSRGQVFRVAVHPEKTSVDVFKGSVEIKSTLGDGAARITPGHQGVETKNKWSIKPHNSDQAFASEPNFIRPILLAELQKTSDGHAILSGQTEAGSQLLINQKSVSLALDGTFSHRAKLANGKNQWTIQSTDAYGARTSLQKSLVAQAADCAAP